MTKLFIFIAGVIAGCTASYFIGSTPEQTSAKPTGQAVFSGLTQNIQQGNGDTTESKSQGNTLNPSAEFYLPPVSQESVDHLVEVFRHQQDDLYSSGDYKDLVYIVRHNEAVAGQIKTRIEESSDYDERISLISVLANSESEATLEFATSLVQSLEKDKQNLGFELLMSMGDRGHSPELNAALLDATSYETDPGTLSHIINHLSVGQLDEQTKFKAAESFQRLIYQNDDTTIKARAIDGLRRIGSQDAVLLAVMGHLNHPSPDVKTSAISAMGALEQNRITPDMLETLKSIVNNPNESELTKEYASTFLLRYKPEPATNP